VQWVPKDRRDQLGQRGNSVMQDLQDHQGNPGQMELLEVQVQQDSQVLLDSLDLWDL